MIYRVKLVNDTWDLAAGPTIGDVLVLRIDDKCYYMRVCRHMEPGSVCAHCALPVVMKNNGVECSTVHGHTICGKGAQNIQPYDMLEDI